MILLRGWWRGCLFDYGRAVMERVGTLGIGEKLGEDCYEMFNGNVTSVSVKYWLKIESWS